jgi:hypothetical protein
MSKDFKRNRLAQLNWLAYLCPEGRLIRSLGTPDGLRALGEFVRDAAAAMNSSLITLFVLFGKHSICGTVFRATAALAVSKTLGGLSCGRNRIGNNPRRGK